MSLDYYILCRVVCNVSDLVVQEEGFNPRQK